MNYRGATREEVGRQFEADATWAAVGGYRPVSQGWGEENGQPVLSVTYHQVSVAQKSLGRPELWWLWLAVIFGLLTSFAGPTRGISSWVFTLIAAIILWAIVFGIAQLVIYGTRALLHRLFG